jgi:hypothetical protein
MKLPGFFKKGYWYRKAALKGAEIAGETFAAQEVGPVGKARMWALRNQARIGAIFGAAWLWAYAQGCPDLYGFDLTPAWLSCDLAREVLGIIGGFLGGAGLAPKDSENRKAQILAGMLPDPRGTVAREEVKLVEAGVILDSRKAELKHAEASAVPVVPAVTAAKGDLKP